MNYPWIIINLFGLIIIASHLGEREHRKANTLRFWSLDEWHYEMSLILTIGIVLNILFWMWS